MIVITPFIKIVSSPFVPQPEAGALLRYTFTSGGFLLNTGSLPGHTLFEFVISGG